MPKRNFGERVSIGIIGGGFIGQVLKRYYPAAKIFDIRPGAWDSLEDVLRCDVIFVAVNFPDNCASASNRAALHRYFRRMPAGRVVVVKSTFVPGTTEFFQSHHPELRFCYNPEFLSEHTAWEDFTRPQFQILGVTEQSQPHAQRILALLPEAPVKRILAPRDAEILKHALNSYFATKVIFFNQLYDAAAKLGANYESIRRIMVQHPSVGDSHSVIWHKGYRGFGGKCLPKDTAALAKAAEMPLLATVLELNTVLSAGADDADIARCAMCGKTLARAAKNGRCAECRSKMAQAAPWLAEAR